MWYNWADVNIKKHHLRNTAAASPACVSAESKATNDAVKMNGNIDIVHISATSRYLSHVIRYYDKVYQVQIRNVAWFTRGMCAAALYT